MIPVTILVTGATGMIGKALIPRLVQTGYSVRVLLRSEREPRFLEGMVEVVKGDVIDPESCYRAVQGVETVVHLAALAHTRQASQGFFQVNAMGTANLAEAAGRAGIGHIILMSSMAVYGKMDRYPFSETIQCYPLSAYGLSKLEAEGFVKSARLRYGMSYTVLRPSVIYGPNDRGNTLRMIKAINAGWFVMVGHGRARKSMTYVENVVDVLLECIANPLARNEVFNVSDPEPYPVYCVAETIATNLGRPLQRFSIPLWPVTTAVTLLESSYHVLRKTPPISVHDVEVFTRDSICDVTKLATLLGYQTNMRLDEGIARTVSWFRRTQRSKSEI